VEASILTSNTILIEKCKWIVTQNRDRKILRNKSIYIEDGRIVEISDKIPVEAEYILNGEGKICMPGLINAHTHTPMSLLRGYADDMALKEWLEKKIWPVERKLKPYHCYIGSLLSCMEMVRTGTTTFMDMYWNPEMIAKAASKIGMRGVIAIGLLDFEDPSLREKMLSEAEKYLVEVKSLSSKIRGALGPHSPYTCSEELLYKCREIAEREKTPLTMHLAETMEEQVEFKEKHGVREVEYLDKIELLTGNLVAVHCVWLTKNEINLMADRKVKVVHCPTSNLKLAVGGVFPLPEFLERNVTIGLGTDGPASNNSLSMFETMKICALIHKHHRWDPSIAPAPLILDLATLGGAAVLNLKIGCIVPGWEADIILLDEKKPNLIPICSKSTLISNLVYSTSGFNVTDVIIGGEMILHEGRFLKVDEEKVYGEVLKTACELLK